MPAFRLAVALTSSAMGPEPEIFSGMGDSNNSQAFSRVAMPFSGESRPKYKTKSPLPLPTPGSG